MEELAGLPQDELEMRRERAYYRLSGAGAHYVIDGIWGLPDVLDEIDERLARGDKP